MVFDDDVKNNDDEWSPDEKKCGTRGVFFTRVCLSTPFRDGYASLSIKWVTKE